MVLGRLLICPETCCCKIDDFKIGPKIPVAGLGKLLIGSGFSEGFIAGLLEGLILFADCGRCSQPVGQCEFLVHDIGVMKICLSTLCRRDVVVPTKAETRLATWGS